MWCLGLGFSWHRSYGLFSVDSLDFLFFFFGVYSDHFSCLSFTFLLSFYFRFFCTILDYFFWDVVLLGEHSAVVVVIQVVCNKTL